MRLGVKVVPGSSRNEVVGWLGKDLKVKLQAPPTDGKANAALCEFLAEALAVPRGAVKLIAGASSRRKVIEIGGEPVLPARDS